MQIIDNFVKDPDLISQMQDRETDFWSPGYSWWTLGSPAISLRHRLVDYIWLQGRIGPIPKAAGFEHWVGVYDAEGKKNLVEVADNSDVDYIQADRNGSKKFSLVHHYDKDECHWNATGEIISPTIGCIYYPITDMDCEGGYLRIYDCEPGEQAYDGPYELIKPVPNRLIVFNPGILHAVEEVTKGMRFAIAINAWENELSSPQMEMMIDVQ